MMWGQQDEIQDQGTVLPLDALWNSSEKWEQISSRDRCGCRAGTSSAEFSFLKPHLAESSIDTILVGSSG